jgi:hypothetical protein
MNCARGWGVLSRCCGCGWPSILARRFSRCLSSAPAHNIWRINSSTLSETSWLPAVSHSLRVMGSISTFMPSRPTLVTGLPSAVEKLPTAQAGSRDARGAPGNRGHSQSRFTSNGFLWEIEHGVHRTGESDGSTWRGSARTPHLGNGTAVPTAAGQSGMVACVLSLCASPCIATSGARAATRARWQASSATLSAPNTSHGSTKDHPAMDGLRGALLPLAKGFRLRGIKAR